MEEGKVEVDEQWKNVTDNIIEVTSKYSGIKRKLENNCLFDGVCEKIMLVMK